MQTENNIALEILIENALTFPEEDVLKTNAERSQRAERLHLAMVVGNSYQRRVKITIITDQGEKTLDSRISAITGKEVKLEKGLFIPIHCIKRVQIL